MSEDPETAPEKIEIFPVGYVENDHLEPVYDEKVYQDVSKIVLKKELADGLYRIEDFENFIFSFILANQQDMNSSSTAVMTGRSLEFLPARVLAVLIG